MPYAADISFEQVVEKIEDSKDVTKESKENDSNGDTSDKE